MASRCARPACAVRRRRLPARAAPLPPARAAADLAPDRRSLPPRAVCAGGGSFGCTRDCTDSGGYATDFTLVPLSQLDEATRAFKAAGFRLDEGAGAEGGDAADAREA